MPATYVPQDGDPVILLIALAGFITLFCIGYIAGRAKTKHDAVPLDTAKLATERDALQAEVERLSEVWKEHNAMALAALAQRDAAQAAHADAIALLRKAKREIELMSVSLDDSGPLLGAIDDHLAKQGGGG